MVLSPHVNDTAEAQSNMMIEVVFAKPSDACTALTNSDIDGKAVFVERGLCSHVHQAMHAQVVGATAVLINNNQGSKPMQMGLLGLRPDILSLAQSVAIPVVSFGERDGTLLAAAVTKDTPVNITLQDETVPVFNSKFDHEWKVWLKADANRNMAVEKVELSAVMMQGGEEGKFAERALDVWGAMLDGNWTVDPELRSITEITPTDSSAVLPPALRARFGYGPVSADPHPAREAELDADGFTNVWNKAEFIHLFGKAREKQARISGRIVFTAMPTVPVALLVTPATSKIWNDFANAAEQLLVHNFDFSLLAIKINRMLSSLPMRDDLLALGPEARPSALLGGCNDNPKARKEGKSCAALLRSAYQWLLSGYSLRSTQQFYV